MANEITLTAALKFLKGDTDTSFSKSGLLIDVAGTDYVRMTQQVGVSEEALDLGGLSTLGYILMFNLDSTNFVEIRPATGVADMIKILAGECALFRMADGVTAPFVIADTAIVQVEYLMIET